MQSTDLNNYKHLLIYAPTFYRLIDYRQEQEGKEGKHEQKNN